MNDLQPINLPGLDPRRPLVIAGPCSAETEEQVIETARELAAEGVRIFRAGLWKPRTKPGGFEGVGAEGVAWLRRVKRETGMYTSTEVATREHVAAALKGGVDLLWIGARTAANPFAMQEIADALRGADVPVLVKNPVSPDLELWIGGVERIYNAGIRRLGVIHRGFTSIDKSLYRNHPMWSIPIELHRRLPGGGKAARPGGKLLPERGTVVLAAQHPGGFLQQGGVRGLCPKDQRIAPGSGQNAHARPGKGLRPGAGAGGRQGKDKISPAAQGGLHPDGLGQEGDSAPLGQAAAHGHGHLPRAQCSGLGQLPGVAVVEWVVFSDDTGKSHREPQTL